MLQLKGRVEGVDSILFLGRQCYVQYLDQLQKEDMENLIKKREVQRNLMIDVAKANEVFFHSIPVDYQ